MLSKLLSGNLDFGSAIIYILSSLVVIFLTLPVHEYAHGWTAVKLGDPTPKYQGRLSLNPFAHIDYLGAACILFFGFGWAKPVQINSNNFKSPKKGMAITAIAGPISNLLVALIALLLMNAASLIFSGVNLTAQFYIYYFFYYIAQINIYLAVFNLIPIPPLDGSRLLSALLPYKQYYTLMRYEKYFFIALLGLLWLGILDVPLNYLSNAIMNLLGYIAGLPFSIF